MEDEGVADAERPRSPCSSPSSRDAPRRARAAAPQNFGTRGLAADTDYAGRSLKGQLTQAGRSGAATTVIIRADDALVRKSGAQDEPVAHADLLGRLSR